MSDESDLTGDGGGGRRVVAGDHEDLDASALTLADGFGGVVSWRIHDRCHSQEAQLRLWIVAFVHCEARISGRFELLHSEANDTTSFVAEMLIGVLKK